MKTKDSTLVQDNLDCTATQTGDRKRWIWQRLWGGFWAVFGYLLSPLCWWNDWVFNLPIAYGFGCLCKLLHPDWLLPGTLVGYWLSNVAGMVMMQSGTKTAIRPSANPQPMWRSGLSGLLTSTLYTGVVVALVQLHWLELPDFDLDEISTRLSFFWVNNP